ncbi:MAG: FliH/SctL family protein [Acidobacteriota bacterium]
MLLIKGRDSSIDCKPLMLPSQSNFELAQSFTEVAELPTKQIPEIFASQALANSIEEPSIDLVALKEEAAALVEMSRAQSEQIIAEAYRRSKEIENAAREKAIIEARANIATEIATSVAAQVEPLRAQLATTLAETAQLRKMVAAQAEQEMVMLSLEIAKKIVRREVIVDREIVISLARVALAKLHNRAVATVRLHPDDYHYVVTHREKLGSGQAIELVEDASLEPGGCRVETELGDVDARIEQQFAEIEQGFLSLQP